MARPLYRLRQFWLAWRAVPTASDLELACGLLSPALMALFLRMQPGEQTHSLHVFKGLRQGGDAHPDLLAAALLHDVGKSLHPLRLWERALIVLGKAFFPRLAHRWGQAAPRGWRRAFVVAEHHPAWGAEMAARAGASPLTAALIRRHQESPAAVEASVERLAPPTQTGSLESRLLYSLQLLDDES